ncbi:MAG: ParB/RepB/Spo0J family partition protein [Anaerolineales bacterium]|jgi:ParB/RepB/Spo0J family partition protein
MADRKVDRSTVLELDVGVGDLSSYKFPETCHHSGRLEWPIMMIPLASIVADSPAQSRQDVFNPDQYPEDAELAASILAYGVIEPILVCRISDPGDGPLFQLIAGDRRRHAALHVGLDMIPAIIRQGGEETNLLTIAENTGRRDLTPYERAIALTQIQEQSEEHLSIRNLAKKTGISASLVSNLFKAYHDSPPALRRLFAEGMAPRSVVELQSLFTNYDESEQLALANKLRGLSRQQVLSIKELVDHEIHIHTAIDTVLGSQDAPEEEPESKNWEDKEPSTQSHTSDTNTLPKDDDQLNAIAALTGASQKAVKGVISKAENEHISMDAVFLACAFIGRGGSARNALKNASELSNNQKTSVLVRRYLNLMIKAQKMLEEIENDSQKAFLNTIFYGR